MISFDDFLKVDIRVGKIVSAEPFKEARKPAYKLTIDFGPELGIKKSSAQITEQYQPAELINRKIAAVINFPPKQIANIISEVLVLGVENEKHEVVLLHVDDEIPLGNRIY